jgi:hypothetical protein
VDDLEQAEVVGGGKITMENVSEDRWEVGMEWNDLFSISNATSQ